MPVRPTDVVRRPAADHPDRPALTFEGATLTYAGLEDRAVRVARGVGTGTRMVWLGRNRPDPSGKILKRELREPYWAGTRDGRRIG